MMERQILKLLNENMGLKSGEKILIFTDAISDMEPHLSADQFSRRERTRALAQYMAKMAGKITDKVNYHEYRALGRHGVEPPLSLWRLSLGEATLQNLKDAGLVEPLLSKKDHQVFNEALNMITEMQPECPQVVMALANYSTTHTSFRKLLTELGARYASMPLFDVDMLTTSLDIDIKRQEQITLAVAQVLTEADEVTISAPNGTNIRLSLKGREAVADTGNLTAPGSYGNLPAGEAFIAPLESTTQGVFVAEWGPTRKLNPVTVFHIEQGIVTKLEGDIELVSQLEEIFSKHPQARNTAELGIGTNEKASRPENILEAEKIYGTIHIAWGDNSTFGGEVKVPFHQDFVLFRPTVKAYFGYDETFVLLQDGKLNVTI
jgi:leucyl aminopeptidase (aminopeptidase T)